MGDVNLCQPIGVEEVDGKIETGFYYIETSNCYPCHGNGWYCDEFIYSILGYNLISIDDIKYKTKPSKTLKSDFFKQFVDNVADIFVGYKCALHGLIGILAKLYTTNYKKKLYYTE